VPIPLRNLPTKFNMVTKTVKPIKKINIRDNDNVRVIMSRFGLNTVCAEALCPNISECYSRKQATFLILGKICTRTCGFCNVEKGRPLPSDIGEPHRVAQAAGSLGLKHVVVTSPTRDDMSDGGAGIFAATVRALKEKKSRTVEILIPDFMGNENSIRTVVDSGPDIIGHNLETVRRNYDIRKGADYKRSLRVLKQIRKYNPGMKTKSAIMLGLGETDPEVIDFMKDLIAVGCEYLSIGQYLAPTGKHYPVREYISPEQFEKYRSEALNMGFRHVESGAFVRSSYNAEKYLVSGK